MAFGKMKMLDRVAMVLLTIGGINWGLVTWFGFNLVTTISFGAPLLENIIYSLVGISGIYSLKLWFMK